MRTDDGRSDDGSRNTDDGSRNGDDGSGDDGSRTKLRLASHCQRRLHQQRPALQQLSLRFA